MSFLSERIYGPIQVKHSIYLMISVLIGWRGLSAGSANAVALAVVVAFIGLISAVAGVKSMSFEAKVLATMLSLFELLTPRRESTERKPKQKRRSFLRAEKRAIRPTLSAVLTALLLSAPATSSVLYLLMNSNLDIVVKVVFCVAVVVGVTVPLILEVL